jgi:hypothetical protein
MANKRVYTEAELAKVDEDRRRRRAVVAYDEEVGLDVFVAPLVIGRLDEPGGGWLSPRGEFYRCPDWAHLELARRLVCDFGWVKQRTRRRLARAEERLDKAGWVRIWDDGRLFMLAYDYVSLTQAQLDVIWTLAERHASMRNKLMHVFDVLRRLGGGSDDDEQAGQAAPEGC